MSSVQPVSTPFSDQLYDKICQRLIQGKQVREIIPPAGRLHIDRPLPFLAVYRRPTRREDGGTERLITGQASYLVASGERQFKQDLSILVQSIVETLTNRFNGFLIIEIWAALNRSATEEPGIPAPPAPAFRILTSRTRPPTATLEALEKALQGIRIQRQVAHTQISYSQKRSPPKLTPLIHAATARKLNCFVIGLEIQPVYRDPNGDELFPEILRLLHHRLDRALKQAFFEFSRTQTPLKAENHLALGQRAVVKAVWDVDRRLANISSSFDFLLQVTPVNTEAAWTDFSHSGFERAPALYYRPLPVDPGLLKRKLYEIPLERIEDPTLSLLFRQKQRELDRQLTMLGDRGTRKFLYGSLQLFGGVSKELSDLADTLLREIPPRSRENSNRGYLNAAAFARQARAEIEYYRESYPALTAEVQTRDDVVGLMVSQGNVLIGRSTRVAASRVKALLQHEIGTHVLTYFNGRAQPFQQLYVGLAGYEEIQEGLAVLAEYLVGELSRPRLRLLAGRVAAARCLINGASFVETFRELTRTYGFTRRVAFMVTVRIHRGGGMVKDAIYLRGLVGVMNYLQSGGELDPLFVGKITTDHVSIIRELQARQVLGPIPLRPRYMANSEATARLEQVRQGLTILDLFDRRRKR